MKAILEFDLNNPDDVKAHLRCTKSIDMALALWEIRNNLRKQCANKIEFGLKPDATHYDVLDLIFSEVNEVFSEHNLIMEDLIV
jgi:hypothetical protein